MMIESEALAIWNAFLARWPVEKVRSMPLEEYVSTQDQDTFTYWIETKTRAIAGIKGSTSLKFGIYRRSGEAKDISGVTHGEVYSWRTFLGSTEQAAFESIRQRILDVIYYAQTGDLDKIDAIQLAPMFKWKIAFLYQNRDDPKIINIFSIGRLRAIAYLESTASYPMCYQHLMAGYYPEKFNNIAEYGRYCWDQQENSGSTIEEEEDMSNEQNNMKDIPLNQILFGPPGTGKTYHTIEAAVRAAAPSFSWGDDRQILKAKYDALVKAKQIRFVTFHQSYGYEEFVEGISAVTNDEGQLSYQIKDGIFKQISAKARKHQASKTLKACDNFDLCWNQFLSYLEKKEDGCLEIPTKQSFFTVTGADDNLIQIKQFKGQSVHALHVKTVRSVFNGEIDVVKGLDTYYSSMAKYLRQLSEGLEDIQIEQQNFVLVIDEINRGNISKIFGELITLIEPSKRAGRAEAIELALPYSGDKFSVPDNLYIIGTMNTADRSLALMDTALRRRFDFVEMMPKPELLGKTIKGIKLKSLLEVLNKRIEMLYDREHTLGHAFLMPVEQCQDENEAFETLQSVFKNKIIPLLQEYFFEDWGKIRLVLGDNQREKGYQFIEETTPSSSEMKTLFGDCYEENIGEVPASYQLSSNWDKPEMYIGIYAPNSNKTAQSDQNTAEAK